MKPRLLDLFCCAGGAGEGYRRAGFHVTGVDIRPQPNYAGDEFHQADAMTYPLEGFDAIHASPPCQGYSTGVSSRSSRWVPTLGKDEPRLIEPLRERLQRSGVPYVIENVVGARDAMRSPFLLCGSMFGLDIARHRLFESSEFLMVPPHLKCAGIAKTAAERRGWEYRDMSVTGKGRRAGTADRWRELLGIDWHTTQRELSEAIPPAYTEFIGGYLVAALGVRGAA